MRKILNSLCAYAAPALAFLLASPVSAASLVQCGNGRVEDGQEFKVCGWQDLLDTVGRIVNFALWGVAGLGTAMIIYGGVVILTANGKQAEVAKGRKIIEGVAVGALIVFGAWAIVNTIMRIFFPQRP
jgi:hypothetical protein